MERIVVLDPQENLLQKIMEYLRQGQDFSGLVLPTKRLATLVLSILAEQKSALVPPRFFNLESLVDHLFEGLHVSLSRLLSDESLRYLEPLETQASIQKLRDAAARARELFGPPLESIQQECELAALIKSNKYQFLHLGHEHELTQLFNEIIQWEVEENGWDLLEGAIQNNVFLSEGSIDTLRLRFLELKHLFDSYLSRLKALNHLPRPMRHTWRIRWILNTNKMINTIREILEKRLKPHSQLDFFQTFFKGHPAQNYLFAGLTSMTPLMARLIRSMLGHPNHPDHQNESEFFLGVQATFIAMAPPVLISQRNPLKQLLSDLGYESDLSLNSAPTLAPFGVKSCTDPLAEVRWCLEKAIALVAQGYAPSSLAILVTDENLYGPYFKMLLPEFMAGCSEGFNVALEAGLSHSLLGRFFESLLNWLEFGEGPGDLKHAMAFLSHPLVAKILQTKSALEAQKSAGDFDLTSKLLQDLSHFMARSPKAPQWSDFCARPLPTWAPFVSFLNSKIRPFFNSETAFKPFYEWAEELRHLVGAFVPLDLRELPTGFLAMANQGLDLKDIPTENIGVKIGSYQSLVDFLFELKGRINPDFILNRKEFINLVLRLFQGLKIQSTGDPFYGIQILGLPEARYMPFEWVMVVGALEGQLPRGLPQDHVLDNSLKVKMGLAGWQLLEAIEDTTFYLFRSQPSRLILTYPDGDGTAVRSRFIELALHLKEAFEITEPMGTSLTSHSLQESSDPFWEPSPISHLHLGPRPGILETIGHIGREVSPPTDLQDTPLHALKTQSATSLKSLLQCPYRYLLEQSRIKKMSYDDEFATLREGKALHKVLETFFSRAPESLNSALRTFTLEEAFTQSLLKAQEQVTPEDLKGSPLMLHMSLGGWHAFAQFLVRFFHHQTHLPQIIISYLQDSKTELAFKTQVPLATPHETLTLHGRIDLLLKTPFGTVVLDFKRKNLPSRLSAISGDEPQLLCYALVVEGDAQNLAPIKDVLLGYFSLIDGLWHPVAAGEIMLEKARQENLVSARKHEKLEELLGDFRLKLEHQLRNIRGEDPMSPHLSFWIDPGHCDTCSFAGICRHEELSPPLLPKSDDCTPNLEVEP